MDQNGSEFLRLKEKNSQIMYEEKLSNLEEKKNILMTLVLIFWVKIRVIVDYRAISIRLLLVTQDSFFRLIPEFFKAVNDEHRERFHQNISKVFATKTIKLNF